MTDPITILYFYRTRWGSHDEFMALFRRNHWPILQEQLAAGRYTAVELSTPRFHGDGRADWDILVSITYRDWAAIQEHSDAEIAAPAVPRPGRVQGGGGAPVRAPRCALGRGAGDPPARTADLRDTVSLTRSTQRRPRAARAAHHRAHPDRARAPRPAREAGHLHDRHPARGVRDADAARRPSRTT